jgi:transcriptional regulator with XRE-family HTH domain
MDHVAENIRRRREQLRLTQEELGELIGVTNTTILRYERPGTGISIERLGQLATALWCEPADLLDPKWDCPPPHPSFGEVG